MKRNMAALVIGNANYIKGSVLKNPANDAVDIAAKLKSYGFHTIETKDATHKEMDKSLKEFKKLLEDNEVGLFFFAGHGMQIDGRNYLLATDTDNADETEAKHSSLALDKVIEVMEKSPASTKIIILDACRDNPWERAWNRTAATRGLASVYAPKGTIIGFATSPGELASDGKGRNGTYTAALLQHIDEPDCTIETMFKQVRNTVAAETRGKQTSWEHTSLSGNFFFNLSLGKVVTTYSETSLADALFVVDETKPSHKIIKGLKSHNWYTQNDALGRLSDKSVKKMADNNLFVLGRNIYQAACGGSNSAIAYVGSFFEMTSGYPKEKRKALLDGMLFEVFFDPQAKLRPKIKANLFNDLFELRRHTALRESFEFLAETLVASRGEFYVLPGRGHELAVTVATTKVKDTYRVDAVYVDGTDVLRPEGEEWATDDEEGRLYSRKTAADLKEQLSQELVVPSRSLKITYTPPEAAAGEIKVPLGYTVRKA
ncbi:caspase family protein [Aliihoeflea sp. 2WW]|uniref:caspase family protein n=1 Tax=Aliihoeflea sp. 2WW TaxID=1381123 RepID=UPI00046704B9|nr:caspase family protein [Aliihoeflea sp. 2WW]